MSFLRVSEPPAAPSSPEWSRSLLYGGVSPSRQEEWPGSRASAANRGHKVVRRHRSSEIGVIATPLSVRGTVSGYLAPGSSAQAELGSMQLRGGAGRLTATSVAARSSKRSLARTSFAARGSFSDPSGVEARRPGGVSARDALAMEFGPLHKSSSHSSLHPHPTSPTTTPHSPSHHLESPSLAWIANADPEEFAFFPAPPSPASSPPPSPPSPRSQPRFLRQLDVVERETFDRLRQSAEELGKEEEEGRRGRRRRSGRARSVERKRKSSGGGRRAARSGKVVRRSSSVPAARRGGSKMGKDEDREVDGDRKSRDGRTGVVRRTRKMKKKGVGVSRRFLTRRMAEEALKRADKKLAPFREALASANEALDEAKQVEELGRSQEESTLHKANSLLQYATAVLAHATASAESKTAFPTPHLTTHPTQSSTPSHPQPMDAVLARISEVLDRVMAAKADEVVEEKGGLSSGEKREIESPDGSGSRGRGGGDGGGGSGGGGGEDSVIGSEWQSVDEAMERVERSAKALGAAKDTGAIVDELGKLERAEENAKLARMRAAAEDAALNSGDTHAEAVAVFRARLRAEGRRAEEEERRDGENASVVSSDPRATGIASSTRPSTEPRRRSIDAADLRKRGTDATPIPTTAQLFSPLKTSAPSSTSTTPSPPPHRKPPPPPKREEKRGDGDRKEGAVDEEDDDEEEEEEDDDESAEVLDQVDDIDVHVRRSGGKSAVTSAAHAARAAWEDGKKEEEEGEEEKEKRLEEEKARRKLRRRHTFVGLSGGSMGMIGVKGGKKEGKGRRASAVGVLQQEAEALGAEGNWWQREKLRRHSMRLDRTMAAEEEAVREETEELRREVLRRKKEETGRAVPEAIGHTYYNEDDPLGLPPPPRDWVAPDAPPAGSLQVFRRVHGKTVGATKEVSKRRGPAPAAAASPLDRVRFGLKGVRADAVGYRPAYPSLVQPTPRSASVPPRRRGQTPKSSSRKSVAFAGVPDDDEDDGGVDGEGSGPQYARIHRRRQRGVPLRMPALKIDPSTKPKRIQRQPPPPPVRTAADLAKPPPPPQKDLDATEREALLLQEDFIAQPGFGLFVTSDDTWVRGSAEGDIVGRVRSLFSDAERFLEKPHGH